MSFRAALYRPAPRRLLLFRLSAVVLTGIGAAMFSFVSLAQRQPAGAGAPAPGGAAAAGVRPFVVVAIFDGLRPDSISAEVTPTLDRLRREGVSYAASHAAFPTVTRVNAPTLSTGTWPQRHGMVSNTMYAPAADGGKLINTGDWNALLKLRDASGGRLVFTKTLAEILQERGLTFVAVSSGSTGSAFLLNPKAPQGIGALVNGGLEPKKRVAFPDRLNDAIMQKFPAAPTAEGAAAVDWTERVLREHVLTELKPDVVFTWLTEPDGPQHEHGVGSPEARAGLHNSDRNLGLLLDALAARERTAGAAARPTHVIVTSDHGFARHDRAVNLTKTLIDAGAKSSPTSDDVTVVSNGQSVLFHVKNRDEATIRKVVAALQANEAVDVIFTRASRTGTAGAASPSGPASAPNAASPSGTASAATTASASGPANAASTPNAASPTSAARPTAARTSGARHYRGPVQGWVPGTFALEMVHAANDVRGADVLCSLAWSTAPNGFGVAGSQTVHSESREGTLTGESAGHGGLNPWTVRNTLLLWGPSFKRGVTLDTPAAIVDIAPTLLSLIGVDPGVPLDGRVLTEAFQSRPPARGEWHETVTVKHGDYEASIHLSGVGNYWYVDEGRRTRRPATAR